MATNAKYKRYDGENWVEYHFTTNAGQVSTTSARKFVTASITVNSNTAGTSGAKVTVGSNDAANIEVDGAHITGQASAVSGSSLQYISASDKISVALGKLDKAAKDAYDHTPAGVLTSNNYSDTLGSVYQALDADLTAIADLTGTSGLLKKTAANTWTLDTNTYLTSSTGVTSVAGHTGAVTAATLKTDLGLGNAAYKGVATSISSSSTDSDLATAKAVWTAIDNLPEPMVFKGSLGTGGTITTLPTAAAGNEGYTYKVITAGTYASQSAKVGDTFICAKTGTSTYEWVLIPSGDEPSGTVTSVAVANATNGGLSVSGSPITSSGTITIGLDSAYGDTKNPYGSKTANYVLAAPNGSAGAPSFRALVADDIPSLNYIPLSGTTALTGSIIPSTPNSVYLGASNKKYYIVYTGKIGEIGEINAGDDRSLELITDRGVYINSGWGLFISSQDGNNYAQLRSDNLSAAKTFQLPNKSGTFAMTDDIPVIQAGTSFSGTPATGNIWIDTN